MPAISLIAAVALLLVLGAFLFMTKIMPANRERSTREHERLTSWLTAIKHPDVDAITALRDKDDAIVIPRKLVRNTGGRHRLKKS